MSGMGCCSALDELAGLSFALLLEFIPPKYALDCRVENFGMTHFELPTESAPFPDDVCFPPLQNQKFGSSKLILDLQINFCNFEIKMCVKTHFTSAHAAGGAGWVADLQWRR